MGKGILLETDGRFGVALTPQGEFCRVPVERTWQVGDEVPLAPVQSRPWKRWALFAAAAVLLLLLVPIGWQVATPQALAVITVDINPSVELTIDAKARVIASRGLNGDGDELLRATGALKGKAPAEAVATLTAKAVELHKLDPTSGEGAVFVAVAPARQRLDADTTAKLEAEAQAAVEALLEEQARAAGAERKAQVITLAASAEVREEAQKNGLSVGKQALKQGIEERYHVEVGVEDLKQMPPSKLVEKVRQQSGVEIKLGDLMRRNGNQDKVPPGQEKKGKDQEPPGQEEKDKDKEPPGQEKKDGDQEKAPPGQEKKAGDQEKAPPGQEKKAGDQEKKAGDQEKAPPGQEKKDRDQEKAPPGQEKKDRDQEKAPPGQEKKDNDKQPPGQEKKDKEPPGKGKQ